jgi:single-stranded DNA-binding protein
MHSQLYLSGRLAGNPELAQTKKGKLFVKLVLETSLIRETRPGETQTESVSLPITLFAGPAEQVKELHKGDPLTLGAHLYGTEFQAGDGVVKRGVQIIADAVFLTK